MQDEAVEILYRVQQHAPGSPLAEQSMLRTGDYYYHNSDFELAGDVYTTFLKRYPRSPKIPDVRLRQAFANLAQFRAIRFDATPLIDARQQMLAIQRDYPELAATKNLQPVIDRINTAIARKGLLVGAFYERTHQPVAAVFEYRFIVKAYPKTAEATEARARLAKMPPAMLSSAEPHSYGNGLGPATQESSR